MAAERILRCLRVRMIFMNCFCWVGSEKQFQNSASIYFSSTGNCTPPIFSTWLWKAFRSSPGQGGSVRKCISPEDLSSPSSISNNFPGFPGYTGRSRRQRRCLRYQRLLESWRLRPESSRCNGSQCPEGSTCIIDASVQPGDPSKLCGRRILNIIGGVLVGIGFDVGGPSFCKAGGAEKISDVGGFLALEGDSLVKMPRESFMCQCGKSSRPGSRQPDLCRSHWGFRYP